MGISNLTTLESSSSPRGLYREAGSVQLFKFIGHVSDKVFALFLFHNFPFKECNTVLLLERVLLGISDSSSVALLRSNVLLLPERHKDDIIVPQLILNLVYFSVDTVFKIT